MPDTLIIIPVLNRPHRVVPLLASIVRATPEPHRTLFMATEGDTAELKALRKVKANVVVTPPRTRGDYAAKINLAYRESTEPFLFCGADDLHFHPGWLTAALKHMADPNIGVVGTNDLGNPRVMRGDHATHSLVRRTYADIWGTIDRLGQVLHEGYVHTFVDDELVGTARARGAFAMALDSHVEHLHPHWKPDVARDETYDHGERHFHADRRSYMQRQRMWTTRLRRRR